MENINFVWSQTIFNIPFRGKLSSSIFNRQAINHFENHSEISNKVNLFKNLKKLCLSSGLNIFNFIPLTFTFSLTHKNFENEIDHFFRYFKALKMFNLFQSNIPLWENIKKKISSNIQPKPDQEHSYLKSLLSRITIKKNIFKSENFSSIPQFNSFSPKVSDISC